MIESIQGWPFWLDLLNLLLAPHIVVTGAALFILLKFRSGFKQLLTAFLDGIKEGKKDVKVKVGSDGLSFETSARTANEELITTSPVTQISVNESEEAAETRSNNISTPSHVNPNIEQLMQVDHHPVLLEETEKKITDLLTSNSLEVESDTARVLIRNLAGTSIDRYFEKDYSLVRGSEIRLLEKLNALVPGSMPVQIIDNYIEETRTKYPDFYTKSISANEYLSWLMNSSLVISTNEGFSITERGVAFLRWMVIGSYDLNKVL